MPPISNDKSITSIEVDTYEDVVSFLKNQYYSVIASIKNIFIVDSGRLITSDMLKFNVKGDIIVGPMISGGVGFDSLGNLNVFYGTSSTLSNQAVALTGLAKRVTESSLFGQGQTAFDVAQRKTNRANGSLENIEDPTTGFGSIASTSGFGLPVSLHFGMVRTSGAIINTYIKHIQRGGIDSIRVVDYL
jgi:hypothetical protein